VIVEEIGVCHDDVIHFFGNQRSVLVGFRVDVFPQIVMTSVKGSLVERCKIINANTSCEAAVIRVVGCQ
jgi:hypothetical protein